jgi:hypothetical protein
MDNKLEEVNGIAFRRDSILASQSIQVDGIAGDVIKIR